MKSIKRVGSLGLFALIALACVAERANAATYTWNRPDSGVYSDLNNWTLGAYGTTNTPAALPTASDNIVVTVNTTGTITMDTAGTCLNLSLDAAAGGLTLTGSATTSTLTIASTGTITHANSVPATSPSISISCNLIFGGTIGLSVAQGTALLNFDVNGTTSGGFAGTGAMTINSTTAGGAVQFRNVATTGGVNNTYTGNITITAGRLNWVGSGSAVQAAFGPGVAGRFIRVDGATAVLGNITTSGNFASGGNQTISIGANGGTLDVAAGLTAQFDDAGQLAGVGGGQLVKTGPGTFLLSGQTYPVGSNTTLRIDAGTVSINGAQVFGGNLLNLIIINGGTLTATSNVNYPNGIVYNSGTFQEASAVTNSTTTFGTLNISTGATFAPLNAGAASTLAFNGGTFSAGAGITALQTVSFNGSVTLGGALAVQGAGTVRFNSPISGASTVTRTGTGGLAINATSPSTVSYTINGGTFGGTGSIDGSVALSGATFAPGDFSSITGNSTVGTLTASTSATSFSAGSFQLGASGTNDTLALGASGSVAFSAPTTITLQPASGFNGTGTYDLITATSAATQINGGTLTNLSVVMPGFSAPTVSLTATSLRVTFTAATTSTLTWTGAASNDLANALNWNPAIAPTAATGPYELLFTSTGAGILANTMPAGTTVLNLSFTGGIL